MKTTEDFITGIASKSFLSGKPYLVKFADGHTQPTGEWLRAHLAEVRRNQTVSAVSLVRRIALPGFVLLLLCGCAIHERPVSAPKMS